MQPTISLKALMTLLVAMLPLAAQAQTETPPGVPVSMVVTLEPKHSKSLPSVEQADVKIRQGKDQRPVKSFESLAKADTELLLLVDDSARGTFDTEIGTLKKFIVSLPANVTVAIGYMRNGMTQFTQNFTRDHTAAASGIRVALGANGADVSPYDSLTDAIRKWPPSRVQRREVLLIGSGIESLDGGLPPNNPYVNTAIESAIKANVVVYSIYSPSVGHLGHSLWRANSGQNFLSQLSDETGGESYYQGFGPPVSFQPFLDQFLEAQNHQYRLTFLARPEKKSGLQPVKVLIDNKDASVAAPDKVWVKASL